MYRRFFRGGEREKTRKASKSDVGLLVEKAYD